MKIKQIFKKKNFHINELEGFTLSILYDGNWTSIRTFKSKKLLLSFVYQYSKHFKIVKRFKITNPKYDNKTSLYFDKDIIKQYVPRVDSTFFEYNQSIINLDKKLKCKVYVCVPPKKKYRLINTFNTIQQCIQYLNSNKSKIENCSFKLIDGLTTYYYVFVNERLYLKDRKDNKYVFVRHTMNTRKFRPRPSNKEYTMYTRDTHKDPWNKVVSFKSIFEATKTLEQSVEFQDAHNEIVCVIGRTVYRWQIQSNKV